MAAASLLRLALSPTPNTNPRLPLLNPALSLHLSLRCHRRRRILRLTGAIEIRSPTEDAMPVPQDPPSVLLDVSGMMCSACVARVRSALSSDGRVYSAAVNMLTETAAVKLRLGEASDSVAQDLAEKLTALGFPTKRRRLEFGVGENVKKWKEMKERKEELLDRSRNRVVFAWTLLALCCGSHASHFLHSVGIHIAHGTRLYLGALRHPQKF